MLAAMLAGPLLLSPARAQTPDRATLVIAAVISVDPGTQVPFPLRITQPAAMPAGSFVRVRGLPPVASLSDGYAISPGSWAVPLSALTDLRLTMPATAQTRTDIYVSLVGPDGALVSEAMTTLTMRGAAARAVARAPADPPPPPAAQAKPTDAVLARQMMEKGSVHLAEGRVAPARMLYERAADMGLAQAAMALGATFDAAELARLKLDVMPDSAEARRWYERARALGAADAEQKLLRLGAH